MILSVDITCIKYGPCTAAWRILSDDISGIKCGPFPEFTCVS